MRHPAGPFTVRVSSYSLDSHRVGQWTGAIYHSRHRSAKGAARRLATIITGKSKLAREVRACIARGDAGQYIIETGAGQRFALKPFRAFIGRLEPARCPCDLKFKVEEVNETREVL